MKFEQHLGDCQQCREVMEAFFSERNQPHRLCEIGRAILERIVRKGETPKERETRLYREAFTAGQWP